MSKFIFTGFSPNTHGQDARRAFGFLFDFDWTRYFDTNVKKLEQWFKEYFAISHAVAFDSGRSALQMALKVSGIGKGDEVILQAFTCVVVANAITNLGARPVYADCTSEYTIDPEEVQKKISSKTRALIIQHTFGKPAQLEPLLAIAKKNNLIVIEDCAHSLGARYHGQLLGTFGDLAMFSFGSDKVISGVRGGMVITNNDELGSNLKKIQSCLPRLPFILEIQHLFHPIFFFFGKKLYHLLIGKWLLFLAQKLHIINRIIYQPEKQGNVPVWFPAQMPNTLAGLALGQIKNLDTWNQKRQANADYYQKKLINKKNIFVSGSQGTWLRFPVQVENRGEVVRRGKENNIILGDWWSTPVASADSNGGVVGYQNGSCQRAEEICNRIINLPTDPYLSQSDLDRVLSVVCS